MNKKSLMLSLAMLTIGAAHARMAPNPSPTLHHNHAVITHAQQPTMSTAEPEKTAGAQFDALEDAHEDRGQQHADHIQAVKKEHGTKAAVRAVEAHSALVIAHHQGMFDMLIAQVTAWVHAALDYIAPDLQKHINKGHTELADHRTQHLAAKGVHSATKNLKLDGDLQEAIKTATKKAIPHKMKELQGQEATDVHAAKVEKHVKKEVTKQLHHELAKEALQGPAEEYRVTQHLNGTSTVEVQYKFGDFTKSVVKALNKQWATVSKAAEKKGKEVAGAVTQAAKTNFEDAKARIEQAANNVVDSVRQEVDNLHLDALQLVSNLEIKAQAEIQNLIRKADKFTEEQIAARINQITEDAVGKVEKLADDVQDIVKEGLRAQIEVALKKARNAATAADQYAASIAIGEATRNELTEEVIDEAADGQLEDKLEKALGIEEREN